MRARAEKALTLLDRIRQGEAVSSGDVAKLAADVLADLPPLLAGARRFLQQVGSEHEAAAAMGFLAHLAGAAQALSALRQAMSSASFPEVAPVKRR